MTRRTYVSIRLATILLLLFIVPAVINTHASNTGESLDGQTSAKKSKSVRRKTTRNAKSAIPLGVVENKSHLDIWITADSKKYCLKPNQSSTDLGIRDADGLLLDGRPVLFDSARTDLGGGKVWRDGAIKVCDPGRLTVEDGLGPTFVLKASISAAGFICPTDPAGYKTVEWCKQHPGWDITTIPIGRPC